MPNMEYVENYQVRVTKTARKQGEKLGLTEKARLRVINELRLLKYWPDIAENFDYEKAFGVLEFKFDRIENKWIRVFVFKDEVRKTMWVINVLSKKTNKLTYADQVSIRTAVSRIEHDLKFFEKKQKEIERMKNNKLQILKGGRDE